MRSCLHLWALALLSFAPPLLHASEILIKIKPQFSLELAAYDEVHRTLGATASAPFELLKNWQVVELPSPVDQAQSLAYYQGQDFVEKAEVNVYYQALNSGPTPLDPLFKEQWALFNNGQRGGGGDDVRALPAWDLAQNKKEVIVAVIDTGVEYTHPDLAQNMWKNAQEIAANGVDDDHNGYIDDVYGYNFYDQNGDPKDDHGHGTHCSGIIAGAHNEMGIRGIAPHAKIMAVKFLGPLGDGDVKNGILAIEYALKNGAQILSNSWGGPPESQALKEMIMRAHELGVLFVAAAGNEHSNNDNDPTYPASYAVENVLSVGASNPLDEPATFSNWGTKSVHLFAPGQYILSSFLAAQYKTASGTSMSTPLVAGAAALLWAHYPQWDFTQIKKRLMETVDHRSLLEERSIAGGRLNVLHALTGEVTPTLGADPRWQEVAYSLHSPHPYPSMHKGEWQIRHPKAKFIRLHFTRFHTQKRMDYVGMSNQEGVMVETLSGDQGPLWSRPIAGEEVTLVLRSDSEVNFFGFEIDKYAVIY